VPPPVPVLQPVVAPVPEPSPVASTPQVSKWIDSTRMACLLCQRQFKSLDQLQKHESKSDLHIKNLEIERYKQMERQQRTEVGTKLDAAKIEKSRQSFEDMVSKSTADTAKTTQPIDDENVGNKMLKAMGWKAGTGLGKTGTGITAPIQAEIHSERAGLGSTPSGENAQLPGDTYQETVRKRARARYDTLPVKSQGNDVSVNTVALDYKAMMNQYRNQNCGDDAPLARPMMK